MICGKHQIADATKIFFRAVSFDRSHLCSDYFPRTLSKNNHSRLNFFDWNISVGGGNHSSSGATFIHRPVTETRHVLRCELRSPPSVGDVAVQVIHDFISGRTRTRQQHGQAARERLDVVRHVAEARPDNVCGAALTSEPRCYGKGAFNNALPCVSFILSMLLRSQSAKGFQWQDCIFLKAANRILMGCQHTNHGKGALSVSRALIRAPAGAPVRPRAGCSGGGRTRYEM